MWTCRALVAGLICVAAAGSARAACEPAKLATKYPALAGRTITVGQDGESPPFSFRDPADFNHLIGLDADMARAVFACAGVPMTFTTGKLVRPDPRGMTGRIDVVWDTLLYTPERAKRLDFVSYMNAATGMIVAKGNPKHVHALGDLCGLRGSATLGTTQEAMLRDAGKTCIAAGKPDVDVIISPDIPSGLRLVQNGRADVLATNKFLGDTMAAANSSSVEMAFGVTTGAKIAAATAKGNPDLVRAMADGLATLEEDGTLRTLFDRYHVDYGLEMKPKVLTQ